MVLLNIDDLQYRWLQQNLPAGVVDGSVNPTPGANVPQRYSPNGSVYGTGTQNAPVAGTIIATGGNQTGLCRVLVQALITGTGTIAAGDICNLGYYEGSSLRYKLMLSAKDIPTDAIEFISNFTGNAPSVKAIGNASANLDYWSSISVTPLV